MQRLGRAARDPQVEAVAVYFVEGEYFDDEPSRTRKRKTTSSSNSKNNKHTKSLTRSIGLSDNSNREVSSESGEDNGPEGDQLPMTPSRIPVVTFDLTTSPNTHTDVLMPILPVLHVLPTGLEGDEFEIEAMKAFINAHSRGLCCRQVLNKYFNNPQGQSVSYIFSDESGSL